MCTPDKALRSDIKFRLFHRRKLQQIEELSQQITLRPIELALIISRLFYLFIYLFIIEIVHEVQSTNRTAK